MTERLDFLELEEIRAARGRSALLFITDRCPVGCGHCSVDSRRDSATITDFELFGKILEWLCRRPGLDVVGISGGEPFVERRGLTLAVRRLVDSGKRVVLYTSGVWGTRPDPPRWIHEVLEASSTVFLSTDAFHEEGVSDETYVNAARAVSAAGAWIVVQVIGTEPMLERARGLLETAFGPSFEEFAEIRPTPALSAGRGGTAFAGLERPRFPGHGFAPCSSVASPTIRYDGLVTACCNERSIMGGGPARLRARAESTEGVERAVRALQADPLLQVIGGAGPRALAVHPRFADLVEAEHRSICELCWKLLRRDGDEPRPDPLLGAINSILEPVS